MTGRNLKKFLTSYRTRHQDEEEQHHLITLAISGVQNNRYNHIHSKNLEELEKHKLKSVKGNQKVLEIQAQADASRIKTLLKQHNIIWQEARSILAQNIFNAEKDSRISFNNFLELCHNYDKQFANDLLKNQNDVHAEFEKFYQAVIVPLKELKDNLLYRLKDKRTCDVGRNTEVLLQVKNAQQQNVAISCVLQQEKLQLDEYLNEVLLKEKEDKMISITHAIPSDILLEENSYSILQNSAINMFLDLYLHYDQAFEKQTKKLQELQSCLLKKMWNKYELWMYDQISSLYLEFCPLHLKNKLPKLKTDIVCRLLQKSYWNVFEVGSIKVKIKFAANTRRSIVTSYLHNYDALHTKLLAIFSEALEAGRNANNRKTVKAEQKAKCKVLHDELQIFHNRQMEIRRLENQIIERKKRLEQEHARKEKIRNDMKRKEVKACLAAYHHDKLLKAESEARQDEIELNELKLKTEQQKIHDKKRIKFRQKLHNMKVHAASELANKKVEEELKKEKRLEILRKTVAVEAVADRTRAVKDTVATRAKIKHDTDNHSSSNQFFGYTSKEIHKDMRIRVEAAMREAGIIGTEYARQIIKKLDPPSIPRPDNDSSGFQSILNLES